MKLTGFAIALTLLAAPATASTAPLGANLEQFDYGVPVSWFETPSQGHQIRMAYVDIAPAAKPLGQTVVLLHGKNFCAGTWTETARALAGRGYRVIAPDQVGFSKSSKPEGYQYSFPALARLTHRLLEQADAGQVILVGHSTGGILALRYALLHPEKVASVVLVNPLGLNDTLAEGVPYADLATLRAEEEGTNAETIRAYQQRVYYDGQWLPRYERWVSMLAGQYASPDGAIVREAQARLSDMIQTQPIASELGRVKPPVTLIIGQRDRTAYRANTAPPSLRNVIRAVPQAAEDAVKCFQRGRIVRLDGLGHAPQVEDPERFQTALADALALQP